MMIPERPALERRVLAALEASPAGSPRAFRCCSAAAAAAVPPCCCVSATCSARRPRSTSTSRRAATTPERFLTRDPRRLAVRGAPPPRRRRRARGARRVRRGARLPRHRPRRRRRAGDVPARRVPRAADVRKLSRAAHGAARPDRGARRQRQPLRADDAAIRRAPCACCATRRRVRDHSRGAAHPRRDPRHAADRARRRARCRARSTTKTTAPTTSWRAWSTRSPTAGRSMPGCIAETSATLRPRGAADPVSALVCAARAGRARRPRPAASPTSCGCTAPAATARSRRSSTCWRRKKALTLTEIALRLQRTPGSTKDYLSWLEDVDLIVSRQKRYSFADPLLRLWVRLHGRPTPPVGRGPGARGPRLRAGAPAAAPSRRWRWPARRSRRSEPRQDLGHHRNRLIDGRASLQLLERQPRRRLRRLLLRSPFRPRHRLARDQHLDLEQPPVGRAALARQPVDRQPAVVRLQPLLQRRLVVLREGGVRAGPARLVDQVGELARR